MMQTLIKCPNCGSSNVVGYCKPNLDHNVKCGNCNHTWRWEDE